MLKVEFNKLKFRQKDFVDDLINAIALQVADLIDLLYQEATSLAPKDVDRTKIQKWLITEANQIVGHVSAGGMEALITEWGSGSLMDSTNPALAAYQASPYWNPARTGNTIVGRPEGTYYDLNDEQQYSKGKFEGIPLEQGASNQSGINFQVQPHQAEHWLRNLVELNRVRVIREMVGVIERFPAQQYFG